MSTIPDNNSESAKKLLMVSPEQYAESVKNWSNGEKEAAELHSKFAFLSNALKSAGVEVETIDGKNKAGGSEELWVRDSYFAYKGKVYLPSARDEDSEGINRQMEDYFAKKNIPTERLDFYFEGGNILVDEARNQIFFAGKSDRADVEAQNASLAKATGADIVSLDLKFNDKYKLRENFSDSERFYHLDTCMCLLPDGSALVYPGAFEESSYKKIQDAIGKGKIIELTRDEAVQMPTNNIISNKVIIAPSMPERVEKILNEKSFSVITDDKLGVPDGFNVMNSSVHCLTNDIPEARTR